MHFSTTISVIVILSAATAEVFGSGEVVILSKPSYIEFSGHEECDVSILSDICSTSLGFTTYPTKSWTGMHLNSAFHFVRFLVIVAVEGVAKTGLTQGHSYPFANDVPVGDVFNSVESKLCDHYPECNAVKVDLDDEINQIEFNLNRGPLKSTKEPYSNSVEEYADKMDHQLSMMDAISNKIVEEASHPKQNGIPEIMWMDIKGLHEIVDLNDEGSEPAALARKSLESSLMEMKAKIEYAHPNKSMIVVVASDSAHTRRFRRAAGENEFLKDHNIADVYDENYPVFFNIFFWFTIAFIMTIIATSMVTAGMDPGRDSIIYRMTSTRMKKDN